MEKMQKIGKAVHMLKILAHPVRLAILCHLLHEGKLSVGALVAGVGGRASQSQVSQFLARMKKQGLVTSTKKGQAVYYNISAPEVRAIIKAMYRIYCA